MTGPGAGQAATLEWWRPDPPPAAPSPAGTLVPPASRAGQTGYYGLMLFTVVLVAAPQEFFPALRPLRLGLLTALLAILVYLVNLTSGRARPPVARREVRVVLLLVAWAVVTLPLSYWPGGSIEVMTELFLKAVAVFILLGGAIDSPQRLAGMAWTLGICAVPVAVTALRNYQAGVYLATAPGRIAGYGTSGLAGNPNDLALLLNLTLPFLVALATRAVSWWARAGAALIALLSVAAVIITFSRSGFLTLAAIGLIYLAQAARRGRVGLAGLVAAGAVAGLLSAPAGYGARLSTVGDIETDPTGSAQNRWADTVVAASFVARHLVVGAGLGMDYLALNQERGARWMPVHNAYLNYGVDLGLPGLGLFLLLLVGCLRAARSVERERQAAGVDDLMTRLAGAARIALIAFALAAFFYPVAYNAYFYYIGGLALAARQAAAASRGDAGEADDAR